MKAFSLSILNKYCARILFGFAFAIAFFATSSSAQPERVLRIWAMGEEGKKLETLIKLFEAENPGVRVEAQSIPWGAAHAKLITAVVGKIPPDISQMGTTWMPEFRAMDALENLNPYIEAGKLSRADFFPGAWETVSYDEGVLGLPWYVETRCLYYRKDILASVGFDHAPKDWNELVAVGKALAGRPNSFGINLSFSDEGLFSIFTWQAGGELLEIKDGKVSSKVREEPVKRGLTFYADLFKEKIAPLGEAKDISVEQGFDLGTMPMFISGPWSIHVLDEVALNSKGKWAIAPLPKGEKSASFLGGCNLVIYKDSLNKDLAWKFLEFALSTKNQIEWYKASDCLPPGPKAWEDTLLAANPMLSAFRIQLQSARPTPMIPEWEQIGDAIRREMEKAVRGTKSPDDALKDLDAEITEILSARPENQSAFNKLLILGGAAVILLFALLYYMLRPFKKSEIVTTGGLDLNEHKGYGKWVVIFFGPTAVLLTVFLILPVLAAFLMSLTNWDIYSVTDWRKVSVVGFDNYVKILKDPLFWKSVKNTLIFAGIGGPLTIIVSLSMALLLERLTRAKAIFRTGFFLPVVTTMVAVAVVWRWIYHPKFGLLNALLYYFGFSGKEWLGDPTLALGCLIGMAVWKNFGYNMIIFIAGLQNIPHVYYEAAELDGAGRVEKFTDITLPLLFPTFILVTILTTIGYLQFFAEPYIMTDGGPLDSTLSVSLYLYRKGFKFFKMGEAAAMSYILFVIIFIFSIGQMLLAKKRETR
ncbi:MAG: hypothetical protein COS94_05705 [Candidatus Hydrogenedentes bacterium CG07_land_8_20_14_0_80_42_17]|nr:MAG: hypothetical protein COS94_05705 [Candidatus Hydrogenedentes bacterium CG07_land_8_20_14_0_80_42_17]